MTYQPILQKLRRGPPPTNNEKKTGIMYKTAAKDIEFEVKPVINDNNDDIRFYDNYEREQLTASRKIYAGERTVVEHGFFC